MCCAHKVHYVCMHTQEIRMLMIKSIRELFDMLMILKEEEEGHFLA